MENKSYLSLSLAVLGVIDVIIILFMWSTIMSQAMGSAMTIIWAFIILSVIATIMSIVLVYKDTKNMRIWTLVFWVASLVGTLAMMVNPSLESLTLVSHLSVIMVVIALIKLLKGEMK